MATGSSSSSPLAHPAAPRFRVLSDLHLEFYADAAALLATIPWDEPTDAQSFLLLAGDVGIPLGDSDARHYMDLLTALAARFRGLFLVAGNHEYYACKEREATMFEVDAALGQMCAALHSETRPVVFLQEGEWTFYSELPNNDDAAAANGTNNKYHVTQLLGCTLWTPVTSGAASRMSDVRRIGFDAAYLRAIHAGQYGWLRKKLGRAAVAAKKKPVAVVTTPVVAPPVKKETAVGEEEGEEGDEGEKDVNDADNVRVVEMDDEPAAPTVRRYTVLHADGSLSSSFAIGEDESRKEEAASPDLRVVMTHHVPLDPPETPTSAQDSSEVASGYYADLFRLWTPAVTPHLWVCGHLHAQVRRWYAGCLFWSCCHGYPHVLQQLKDRPAAPVYTHELSWEPEMK